MSAGAPPPRTGPPRAALGILFWLIPVAALLLIIGYAAVRKQQPASITAALARGQRPPAPEFRLPRFDGGTLALSDLRGRAVVLNFWASWCVPCKDEAPLLERAWREYRDQGLVVVGVNIQDLEPEARRFIAQTGATYLQVRDRDGRVSRAYGTTGVPETFFIDRNGRIVSKFPGAAVEWRIWEEAIERLLGAR
ncbi:MAG: TlpA disulfide reductase family protein [Armatimonadota bacterium]|nr:TlpA disulfide reductase family protein [Armatimonadota bacterium]MDR7451961.1 TlpA disulfide reductase family protein [Armatimonadota bacterium]MDR7466643.1 TlpA disulfide reductase family protein [Armatimonadota bacterium]MDR7492883.1 TlpA disulfide reductase family protein [Armatimonadota bacterium]MDR7498659.1 TlpA disulfide reductase family protein [Armatimonadota bacterium]